MNTWRVDRNLSAQETPCGINSILYIGDSHRLATKMFNSTTPGKDSWGKPNESYGVTLACYNKAKGAYEIVRAKFPQCEASGPNPKRGTPMKVNPNGLLPTHFLISMDKEGELEILAAFHNFPSEKELQEVFTAKRVPHRFILVGSIAVTSPR